MNNLIRRIRFLACAAVLAGCITSQNTQLPTLRPTSRVGEYVYHDPFPDRDAGPAVDRPRGFERARSVPQRTLERRAITDDIVGSSGGGSSNNPSASKYPSSVDP
jgi:hypothetical protein